MALLGSDRASSYRGGALVVNETVRDSTGALEMEGWAS
jgi:hypothetical protein